MKRTPMLKTSEESAWLFHEIGRAYWELNSYKEAKEYGIKSLDAAQDCGDQVWQLNAFMLIAQAEGSHCDSKCFESCSSLSLSLQQNQVIYQMQLLLLSKVLNLLQLLVTQSLKKALRKHLNKLISKLWTIFKIHKMAITTRKSLLNSSTT